MCRRILYLQKQGHENHKLAANPKHFSLELQPLPWYLGKIITQVNRAGRIRSQSRHDLYDTETADEWIEVLPIQFLLMDLRYHFLRN